MPSSRGSSSDSGRSCGWLRLPVELKTKILGNLSCDDRTPLWTVSHEWDDINRNLEERELESYGEMPLEGRSQAYYDAINGSGPPYWWQLT